MSCFHNCPRTCVHARVFKRILILNPLHLLSLMIVKALVPVINLKITTAGAPKLITSSQFPLFPVIWKFPFLKPGFFKLWLYFEHLCVCVGEVRKGNPYQLCPGCVSKRSVKSPYPPGACHNLRSTHIKTSTCNLYQSNISLSLVLACTTMGLEFCL